MSVKKKRKNKKSVSLVFFVSIVFFSGGREGGLLEDGVNFGFEVVFNDIKVVVEFLGGF